MGEIGLVPTQDETAKYLELLNSVNIEKVNRYDDFVQKLAGLIVAGEVELVGNGNVTDGSEASNKFAEHDRVSASIVAGNSTIIATKDTVNPDTHGTCGIIKLERNIEVRGSFIEDSAVENSAVVDSTVIDSRLSDSVVYDVEIEKSKVRNSFIHRDQFRAHGRIRLVNSHIEGSVVINEHHVRKTISDSNVQDSTVTSSDVINDTHINVSNVSHSTVDDSIINKGRVRRTLKLEKSVVDSSEVAECRLVTSSEIVEESDVTNSTLERTEVKGASTVRDSHKLENLTAQEGAAIWQSKLTSLIVRGTEVAESKGGDLPSTPRGARHTIRGGHVSKSDITVTENPQGHGELQIDKR